MKFLILSVLFVLASQSSFALETTKGMKKDYEQFKQDMSQKLDTAEVKLKELKEKAKAEGSETKQKMALELEASKNKLREQQAELKYESKSGWQKMKKGLSEAAESLNAKIQKALE